MLAFNKKNELFWTTKDINTGRFIKGIAPVRPYYDVSMIKWQILD